MAFQKNKVTQYGVTAGYWTLLRCEISAFPQGFSESSVTYGLFASHEDYNAGKQPLEQISFRLPYEIAIPMAYPILPDLESYIRGLPGSVIGKDEEGNDIIEPNFFADAETAPE